MTITEPLDRTTRLLAAYHENGEPSGLRDHLTRYGTTTADGLIDAVEAAGLTGREGAGLPVAQAMRSVAERGDPPVVVVAAAEGEPASAKNQLLLTVAPHLVIDGATLAAQAVGAREIVVCADAGAKAAADTEFALAERNHAGLTAIPTRVRWIPPGHHSGEGTSLVNWINGGEARPAGGPRPGEDGIGGRPRMVSDAETYAHIALIARYGPEWFREHGTPETPGTGLFTVSGAVASPGVVEAPMGTSVGELLWRAGGPSEPVQAILAGGYGGGWLPPALLSATATADVYGPAGVTLGPGIVVALPERACGLAESARVLDWLASEGAGQCAACTRGIPGIAEDFAAVTSGGADEETRRRLAARLSAVPEQDACPHLEGAARFAASALKIFQPHLDEHEHGCPYPGEPGVLPLPKRY